MAISINCTSFEAPTTITTSYGLDDLIIYHPKHPFPMQPYEFEAGSERLTQTPGGSWIVDFDASFYASQTITEVSNSIDPSDIRVIEFEITGSESGSLAYRAGSSAPYTRGNETAVELVLYRGGDKKGTTTVYYP